MEERECRSIPSLINILEGVYGRLSRIEDQTKKFAQITFHPQLASQAAEEIAQLTKSKSEAKQQPPLMKQALDLVHRIDSQTEVIEKQLGLAYQELTDTVAVAK